MSAVLAVEAATLPVGWYWTTMGEIAAVVGGGTPRTTDPANFEGGDVPWITPADLSGYTEKYISHGARFITRKGLESSSAQLLPTGTVLFTSRAPIGYVAIARNPLGTNQGFKGFVLKDGVLPEYVYWWLKGSKQRAEALASGTTFLELSGANAKKLPIPIAPLDEQRRIVAEIEKQFSRLDAAVANLKRIKSNLSRQKLAIFISATSGRLLAESAASSDDSGVGETQEDLPAGWRWAEIGELAGVVRGGSPRPAGDPRYFGGPIPWITVGPITADEDDYLRSVPTGLTEAGRERSRYIEPHTLLLTNSGATLGVPKISLIGRCINDGVAALLNIDYPLKKYLLIYLRSKTAEMRRVNQGAAQPNLNTTIIKQYRVPVPPTDEQQRIVAEVDRRLSIVREVEAEVDANLKRAQALRQAVLARAFFGSNEAVTSSA